MEVVRTKDSSGTECTYVLSKSLGAGGFGEVFLAVRDDDDAGGARPVAVKKLSYLVAGLEERSDLYAALKEKWVHLDRLSHENVVRYFSTQLLPTEEYRPRVDGIVVMEYCSLGSLSDFLQTKAFTWAEIYDTAKQILDGLVYLHDERLVHADMKTGNVVLESEPGRPFGRLYKIIDLDDYVRLSSATSSLVMSQRKNLRATVQFMSPELLSDIPGKKIGRKTDIWSFGCIVIDMIRLGKPFRFVQTLDGRELPSDILRFTRSVKKHVLANFVVEGGCPEVPWGTPDMVARFLRKCFKHNPQLRYAARELLGLNWMRSGESIQGYPVNVEDLQGPSSQPDRTTTTTGIVEFKLVSQKNKEGFFKLPQPAREMKWDLGLLYGARLMVHHGEKFPYHLYQQEIQFAPRIIEHGQPLPNDIRSIFLKVVKAAQTPQNPLSMLVMAGAVFLLDNPNRMSSLITMTMPTIGPAFQDLCEWMNRYTRTSEYVYVYKHNATWDDIRIHLDNKDPVLVQYSPGEQIFGSPRSGMNDTKSLNEMLGITHIMPDKFPIVWAAILRGYREVSGKVDEIYLADANGDDENINYDDFTKHWAAMPDHPFTKKFFECARYRPNSMIYRQKRHG